MASLTLVTIKHGALSCAYDASEKPRDFDQGGQEAVSFESDRVVSANP
jgi:hypothetical protein